MYFTKLHYKNDPDNFWRNLIRSMTNDEKKELKESSEEMSVKSRRFKSTTKQSKSLRNLITSILKKKSKAEKESIKPTDTKKRKKKNLFKFFGSSDSKITASPPVVA